MNAKKSLRDRREPRFVTSGEQPLHSETFIDFDDPVKGSVIDISTHGLRLLCQGSFAVGQAFVTELKTDRLHGVFPGVIRHIEPWVDGKTVLGCELLEKIPADVLETLAVEKVINRRSDDRIAWKQAAKMSYELQSGDVDIEIQDCSLGGLRISSPSAIPADVCVRISFQQSNGEPVMIDARTAWQSVQDVGCSIGLAFTNPNIPSAISQILTQGRSSNRARRKPVRKRLMRPTLLITAGLIVAGVVMLQTGWWV